MEPTLFYLREAASDISGMKMLADFGARLEVRLDYSLASSVSVGVIDQFLSAPNRPGLTSWPAGDFVLALNVAALSNAAYGVELWRAAVNGADIALIGRAGISPSYLSMLGVLQATINLAAPLVVVATDRLKLKLLMGNPNPAPADSTMAILASASSLTTPFDGDNRGSHMPGKMRGRFLGKLARKGEPQQDADGFYPIDGVSH